MPDSGHSGSVAGDAFNSVSRELSALSDGVKEEESATLVKRYEVPSADADLASIFELLTANLSSLGIVDFSVTQTTLEDVCKCRCFFSVSCGANQAVISAGTSLLLRHATHTALEMLQSLDLLEHEYTVVLRSNSNRISVVLQRTAMDYSQTLVLYWEPYSGKASGGSQLVELTFWL